MTAADRAQAVAVERVFDFMRERKLALADLIEVGGEDFQSASAKRQEKARRVEKCWELMARLAVRFADLERTAASIPDKPGRTRRGGGHFSEAIENTAVSDTFTTHTKSNEINGLGNLAPVGAPETNSSRTEKP